MNAARWFLGLVASNLLDPVFWLAMFVGYQCAELGRRIPRLSWRIRE